MPLSIASPATEDLRDLARSLCEAALQDPDMLVYSEVPFEIATPKCVVRLAPRCPVQLWTFYIDQARNLKRFISKG
jgi:hypothetical protein